VPSLLNVPVTTFVPLDVMFHEPVSVTVTFPEMLPDENSPDPATDTTPSPATSAPARRKSDPVALMVAVGSRLYTPSVSDTVPSPVIADAPVTAAPVEPFARASSVPPAAASSAPPPIPITELMRSSPESTVIVPLLTTSTLEEMVA